MSIFYNSKTEEVRVGRIVIVAISLIIAIILFFGSITRVPVGSVGVKTNMARVTNNTYSSGWYFKIPFAEHMVDMSIQQQTVEYPTIQGELSGKELINMTLKMTYSLNGDKAAFVYENYGENYITTLMPQEEVFDVVKGIVATYDIEDVRTNRAAIMSQAADGLRERFGSRGITLTSLALANYDFGELEASIDAEVKAKQERKTVAEQNQLAIERAENEKKVAEIQAEKAAKVKKTEAQAEADAVKIKAEGEANAIKIKGEAEAEANKKLSESLTPDLVKIKEIEQWNGSKATVILGEQTQPIIPIPETTTATQN
jgi:regulator of protease activity HflC (stomatin/prohibitin superfamily)